MRPPARPLAAIIFLILAGPLHAADEPATLSGADTAWMLTASALVLLMTPGLAFFYGGLVRSKNMLSVLMQCFTCMCLMTVVWVIIGYTLAFGDTGTSSFIGNLDHIFLRGVGYDPGPDGGVSPMLFMAFQGMFAVITPALMIGAFAERMKFGAFCTFSVLWLLLVYCPVCHWVWCNLGPEHHGFFGLGADGALDFAGGTVVHINAGIAALAACLLLGPRKGYPKKISPPHNLPFAVLGAGMLWFGWFGFNAGSAVAANGSATNAFVVTNIAAAAAGLVWLLIDRLHNGKATMLGTITGAVGGLVAITPASGSVGPMGALFVGAGASVCAYFAVDVVKRKVGYDDSLDVFGVHGVAGIWGAIAAGLWATNIVPGNDANGLITAMMTEGVEVKDGMAQLLVQFKAVIYTLIYSGIVSVVLLKLVDATLGLRADVKSEQMGLDLTEHAEHAYTLLD